MAKRMKIETTIANLKKMHESYKAEVQHYSDELDAISKHLKRYEDLVAQTADAIDALEGRPTLKKTVEEALKARIEPLNAAVGGVCRAAALTLPDNLPPPEPGFRWDFRMVSGDVGEWVLVPATTQNFQDTNVPLVELPPILDDEQFVEKPEDFL